MPSTPKKTLAIIDDDTELLERAQQGARVHLQRRAPAWATRARIRMLHDEPPAAVVLDLDLVTFDAFELLQLIAGDPDARAASPVLTLSSTSDFAHLRARAPRRRRPSTSPSRSRRTSSGRKIDALTSRPQAAHQRPPQARRPARRQRPGHAGAAGGRAQPARTTAAGASARSSSPRASSASRTSSRPWPARCTSAWSTSRRPHPTPPPSGCCRATSSCVAGSSRSASTRTAASSSP